MNSQTLVIAGIAFALGLLVGNFTGPEQGAFHHEGSAQEVEEKLAQAHARIEVLNKQITAIGSVDNSESTDHLSSNDEEDRTAVDTVESGRPEKATFDSAIESAYQALSNHDPTDAMAQFNALLAEVSTDEERQQAIDGLIAAREAIYQYLVSEGDQIHAAMWQLFEINKLRPNGLVVGRAKQLSQDILARSEEYIQANDLVSGADYLSSLVHTTNMMGYEVDGIDRDVLVSRMKEIEANPVYQKNLYSRATNNLMNGGDIEKSIVFWDYAKLAEIDTDTRNNDPSFQTQFAEATLLHLDHLKNMNQMGEVNSRLNFIRYAFPELMKDERISGFY